MRLRRLAHCGLLLVVIGCQGPPATQAPTRPAALPTSVLVQSPPAATQSRVDVLNAATAAYRSGDAKTAAELYERVANTPPGLNEGAAASAITDFARFSSLVTLLADNREPEARAQLDALQQGDPAAALARLGAQLWDQYGMTGQLGSACAQLQPQIASQATSQLGTLQSAGVLIEPQTLCSGLAS